MPLPFTKLYGKTSANLYSKAFSQHMQAKKAFETAADTYFMANDAASYDDWKRARAHWNYFCEWHSGALVRYFSVLPSVENFFLCSLLLKVFSLVELSLAPTQQVVSFSSFDYCVLSHSDSFLQMTESKSVVECRPRLRLLDGLTIFQMRSVALVLNMANHELQTASSKPFHTKCSCTHQSPRLAHVFE